MFLYQVTIKLHKIFQNHLKFVTVLLILVIRTKLTWATLQACIFKWVKYRNGINVRQVSIIKSMHINFDMAHHSAPIREFYTPWSYYSHTTWTTS